MTRVHKAATALCVVWASAHVVDLAVAQTFQGGGGGRGTPADERQPISAFGLPLVTEPVPITQQHFAYGIHPRRTRTLTGGGGGAAASGASGQGADLVLTTDATAHAYAIARSYRALHYRPGVGQVALFTAAFSTPAASSQQFAGAWSPGAGYFVGYNGTTWGAFARTGGMQGVHTLTVTTAATSASNVTVTLDGTAVTVAVTNQTGNPSRTAWEIAAGNYATAGAAGTWGWDAHALGAVVYFVAKRARVNAGAFTFAAGTTGSAATFAAVREGAAEVEDFGSPATPGNWTWTDALDGTGPSGMNLDKSKGIIYGISYGHLGHRGARVLVANPGTGRLSPVAEYRAMGKSTANVLNNPTLFVGWGLVSNGSTTPLTMYAGSGAGQIEGKLDPDEGEPFSVSVSKTGMNGTAVPILALRNAPVAGLGGQTVRPSRMQTHLQTLSVGVNGGAAGTWVDVDLLLNPAITNVASFTTVDATRLGLWSWSDTATTTAVVTGGTLIASLRVPVGQVTTLPLHTLLDGSDMVAVNITPQANNNATDVTLSGHQIQ
jgi:hypothetical protein